MRIHGAGCCLIDYLYTNISFSSEEFQAILSRRDGDGGINPGGLVFSEDLEEFTGRGHVEILNSLIGRADPDAENLGGPAVVALIHAAQLLQQDGDAVAFFGMDGKDDAGMASRAFISRTPIEFVPVKQAEGAFPSTVVLSDPFYRDGAGERSFVNTIGAAGELAGGDLPEDFFAADIVLLGGTALVPQLHRDLDSVLGKAKEKGAVTVVGTVYDFRNQKAGPDKPWPLVTDYRYIDLLVMDEEEALRISGTSVLADAVDFFRSRQVGACIITRGSRGAVLWSGGALFARQDLTEIPVAVSVDEDLSRHPEKRGDTTGCGDNFLGGATASLCRQLAAGKTPDLLTAASWGTVSGGLACYTKGGTYFESRPGEKLEKIKVLLADYRI